MTATTAPTQHTAGDSFAATLSGDDYPATDGWAAQLILIGPARYTVNATASGADHAAAETATATAAWQAGSYALRSIYTRGSDRVTVALPALRVLPDPAASGTGAAALLSPAEQALQDLEAHYRGYISDGDFKVGEYQFGQRRQTFRTVADLLQALAAARRDVAAEQSAQRIAAGGSPRQRFVVRM